MKLHTSQTHRFLQKLALTPQMRQSIQLLGMATKDLHEFVDAALEKNPFLKKINEIRIARALPFSDSDEEEDYLSGIKQELNPRDSLVAQLRMAGATGKDIEIAEALIYEMDDNGYIGSPLDEIAQTLGVSPDEIDHVLSLIQGMEPAGIGARDLQECLQIQLTRQGKGSSLEYAIVSEHLSALAQNDVDRIAQSLQADTTAVRAAMAAIKKLNPRPASSLLAKEAPRVIPDLIVEIKGQRLELSLNRDWMPSLEFHNPYTEDKEIAQDKEARDFIKENKNAATNLIDHLKRREETLYRVCQFIVSYQKDHILDNAYELKGLTIQDIADALEMHISTVSRTIAQKYLQVENKIFPLNALLSHRFTKKNGDITSKTAIKKRVREIISQEKKDTPLSDSEIQEILAAEHIVLTRRTIAKYRNTLKILPTHLRRKRKPV